MNFGELKQAILTDTHRPDLAPEVARFVRQCEGLIRRDLIGYQLGYRLTDSDHIEEGLYTLPTGLNIVRSIHLVGRNGDALSKVPPASIKRLPTTAAPFEYAMYSNSVIEFRGYPPQGSQFDILYYGIPEPFQAETDTNDLLRDHESLYMAGSKFYVYLNTQDRELAADELEIFNGILARLNESISRQIGGARIPQAYDFSVSRGSY